MQAQDEAARQGWKDQRKVERVKLSLKLSFKSEAPAGGQPTVGPAVLHDLSLHGACVTTKHHLEPGQTVDLTIPLSGCPDELGLPEKVAGQAVVIRVSEARERTRKVAIRFKPALAESVDFARFMGILLSMKPEPIPSY